MSNLIIFDLDGVITSEEAYWDAAGLTLHELLYSPHYWNIAASTEPYRPATTAEESRRISRATFPASEIVALKARAINSNWDTCYVTVCLHLINLLALVPDLPALLPLQPWNTAWLAAFRAQKGVLRGAASMGDIGDVPQYLFSHKGVLRGVAPMRGLGGVPQNLFSSIEGAEAQPLHPLSSYIGLELISRFDSYTSEVLGYPIEGVFSRYSPFWPFCQNIFQEWYLGDKRYTQSSGHAPAQSGKPGCVYFEQPLLPIESMRATLETLHQQGYVLGFATGRPSQEAEVPLKLFGLLDYFDERHSSTYDDVVRAEAELRANGDQTLLGKPHPFPFLIAFDHTYVTTELQKHPALLHVIVGDSTGDILAGRAAGVLTVAVLTGAHTPEARLLLAQSSPDFTIDDVTELPALLAHIDSLATIQHLQFHEREKAERLLRRWFARHMNLKTDSVTLTPKPVSLNSFNGFYRVDGEDYFFKTHVEEQGSIQEYYHAEMLHQAGYNVVMPLRTLHQEGRQMVIYPVVRWPVMFDLMRAVETGDATDRARASRAGASPAPTQITVEMLAFAEQRECERLLGIYRSTLAASTAEEHAAAAIHQLFWHRLTGGRFKSFYQGKNVPLPHFQANDAISFAELLTYHWVINGIEQKNTLGKLIEHAKVVLNPAHPALTVIGHGDAHFGNVFLEYSHAYLYFDPAFAGRHSPLLDVVKPLFHNVFAMWMYFPHAIAHDLQLSVTVGDGTLFVEHNYTLTAVRQAILQTKIEYLLTPLIAELRAQGGLPTDWQEVIQLALMCCPLLTINLIDGERMPPTVSWLGLAQAVQMGNSGIKFWRKDP